MRRCCIELADPADMSRDLRVADFVRDEIARILQRKCVIRGLVHLLVSVMFE